MNLKIRLAKDEDIIKIKEMLKKSSLSTEGVEEKENVFLVAEEINSVFTKKIVAMAGIEKRGKYGFLRSLVLRFKSGDSVVGINFITNVIQLAKELKFKELYLLTKPTSQLIFEQLDFVKIGIEQLPDEIKTSKHFQQSYNASVVIMRNY